MRTLKIGVVWILLAVVSHAVNMQKLIWYKSPVKRIQGQIVDASGVAVDLVDVNVWSNPELWSDDSLSPRQKRLRQRKVAASTTDEKGKFSIKKLQNGSYEVEFRKAGFNDFSVIVQVNSAALSEKFCVTLYPGGATNNASFQPCAQ
ncbi:MAG TPA: carboxypeptidase-like regulatory domain-containing protein [Candidatus Dormibacteraeota bacterium]|nr:carboxypeptidase-like regulatory domain-containing protein [Candidatus Dormibacteraeota bacterium]